MVRSGDDRQLTSMGQLATSSSNCAAMERCCAIIFDSCWLWVKCTKSADAPEGEIWFELHSTSNWAILVAGGDRGAFVCGRLREARSICGRSPGVQDSRHVRQTSHGNRGLVSCRRSLGRPKQGFVGRASGDDRSISPGARDPWAWWRRQHVRFGGSAPRILWFRRGCRQLRYGTRGQRRFCT